MERFFNFCSENKKVIVVTIAILLVIVLLLVFALELDSWLLTNFHSLKNSDIYDDMRAVTIGDIEYLPKDMSTYLLMGIDNNNKIDEEGTGTNEQSDFILFLVCDHTKKTITALQINRDTMTDVKILNQYNGNVISTDRWQITLAHTYGLDEQARSLNTIDAFKALMNNVPVSQYITFTMPVVNSITDAVGGLSFTITDAEAANAGYNVGDEINLDKTNALDFVREREDNIGRMARQRLFMDALLKKFKSSSVDYEDYLEDIYDYIATNLSENEFQNIESYIDSYTFNGIKTLTGTSGTKKVAGVEYATFEADESSINDFLINYCYDVREK